MIFSRALAATISINSNLPGLTNISTVGPAGWVKAFYVFALIFSGILAFGAIVYGGFRYATSAGNASKQSEGRAWIWSSLIGLLLLGGAYLILLTINPNLVNLQNPALTTISVPAPTTSAQSAKCTPPSSACGSNCCVQGDTCNTQYSLCLSSQSGKGCGACQGKCNGTCSSGVCKLHVEIGDIKSGYYSCG